MGSCEFHEAALSLEPRNFDEKLSHRSCRSVQDPLVVRYL
eukprot:IDg20244t1